MDNPTFTINLETKEIEFNINGGVRGLKGDKGDTGSTGPAGADGYTPVKGVDYFTAEDIASLNIPTKTSDLINDSLQDKIDNSNKLNADLVDDSSSSKKLLTTSGYQTINGSKSFNDTARFLDGLVSIGMFVNDTNDSSVFEYYGGNDNPKWNKKTEFIAGATTIAPTNDSDVANKKYVDDLISALSLVSFLVVQTLPQTGESNIIYLVPKSTAQTNNYYDEYIYTNNAWEKIGDTEIDLTNYVQNTDYATSSKGGVIKFNSTDSGFNVSGSGLLYAQYVDYNTYLGKTNNYNIAKGTLENVITGKDLTTKAYVDGLVGDISNAIDLINGENI